MHHNNSTLDGNSLHSGITADSLEFVWVAKVAVATDLVHDALRQQCRGCHGGGGEQSAGQIDVGYSHSGQRSTSFLPSLNARAQASASQNMPWPGMGRSLTCGAVYWPLSSLRWST